MVVFNYTGDRIHFGLALEKARQEGIKVIPTFLVFPSRSLSLPVAVLSFAAGALVIVINYTGDRIHFGLAVEKAKSEGLKVSARTVP